MRSFSRVLLLLLSLSVFFEVAEAKISLKKLARAVGDVASLGATRHQRHEERRERDAEIARQKAEAADREKHQKITHKTEQIAQHKRSYADLLETRIRVETLIKVQGFIQYKAQRALAQDIGFIDRIKMSFSLGKNQTELTEDVLAALFDAVSINPARASIETTEKSLSSLRYLVQKNQMEMRQLLDEAFRYADRDDLGVVIEGLARTNQLLINLATSLDAKLKSQIDSHNAAVDELVALKSDAQVTKIELVPPLAWLSISEYDSQIVGEYGLNFQITPEVQDRVRKQCDYLDCAAIFGGVL